MRRILGPILGLALLSALTAVPATANSFPDTIDLPDGWQPEGITSDGTTLYVGSLVDGAIWRGTLQSGTGDTFIEGVDGQMAVGIDYEDAHDRLWVAGGNNHTVRVYDATSGELLETYTFDSGFINDVVATEDAVYATDSNIQQLIVIPLGANGELPAPDDATTIELGGEIEYMGRVQRQRHRVGARLADHRPVERRARVQGRPGDGRRDADRADRACRRLPRDHG